MNRGRLKRWLEQNQMTQRELAEACGCTPGLISQYINGTTEPSTDSLKRLAGIMGITTDELLFDDVEQIPTLAGRRRA